MSQQITTYNEYFFFTEDARTKVTKKVPNKQTNETNSAPRRLSRQCRMRRRIGSYTDMDATTRAFIPAARVPCSNSSSRSRLVTVCHNKFVAVLLRRLGSPASRSSAIAGVSRALTRALPGALMWPPPTTPTTPPLLLLLPPPLPALSCTEASLSAGTGPGPATVTATVVAEPAVVRRLLLSKPAGNGQCRAGT